MTRKLLTILFFLGACLYAQKAEATAYYVDFQCTTCTPNNGLATTTAFTSLDAFTEAARTAGDIAFVRRNTASTTGVSDLNFTSDGTIASPIQISADNDNLWNDASTTAQTYTVAVATSTLIASATITGMQAGDWFYVTGDCTQTYNSTVLNQCEYFYEVASISGTQLSLYMPYKGDQTGAGNSLVNLGKNPQWNVTTGSFAWLFDTDNYWFVKGLDIRSTSASGVVGVTTSIGHTFMDTILNTNGVSVNGFTILSDAYNISVNKMRFLGGVDFFNIGAGTESYGTLTVRDSLLDGGAVANSDTIAGFQDVLILGSYNISLSDTVAQRFVTTASLPGVDSSFKSRNLILRPVTNTFLSNAVIPGYMFFEDFNGTIGDNRANNYGAGTNSNIQLLLSTSTLRSGGGPTAIEVRPTTNTTSIWDFNKIKLFEYPIYTNTTSKQYDVYFRNATSTEFTTDPTTSELWIQCEYWAHDTNATSTRKIKKSTGVLDFNGSTAWQNLTVTCQPSQTGILYLSGWYAKTKEASQSNIILIDNTPVIQ